MTEQEWIQEAQRRGLDRNEAKAKFLELQAQGAFESPGDVRKRTEDEMVGANSPEEEFDRFRPRLADEWVGEDIGRSIDASIMGMGEQIRSFQRGIENLNPWQTEEEAAENQRLAEGAEELAERSYGSNNPAATMAGEVLTTAPTWLLPGGLLAQMGYGAAEAGLDHSSGSNAGLNALFGGVTTGIFGKSFDMVGRMFSNLGNAGVDAITRRPPRVPGQTADETKRLLQVAKDEGVNLTPAQRSRQRRQAQDEARMSSQPSGQKLHDMWEEQRAQINQMVGDRFGIDNAASFSPDVMKKVDLAVSKAYKEAEAGLTPIAGDDAFLEGASNVATMRGLNETQKEYFDEVAMDIADGIEGKDLIRTRKELQRSKANNQQTNGDYADALQEMVNQIDDLIERAAPTEVGAKFADARDMARVQMALEKTAGVIGKDGNINGRSFDTALGNIYKREFKRGHGSSNPGTQRVFDAARLANFLSDGIPNSGTATREYRGLLDRAIDKSWGEANVDFYLNNPRLYGLFDPMAALPTKVANVAGRASSQDEEEVRNNLLGID